MTHLHELVLIVINVILMCMLQQIHLPTHPIQNDSTMVY